jgi:ATP-dependent helicase HrpA
MPPDFLIRTSFDWLRHYPRYLQAMRVRLSRLGAGGHVRDEKLMAEITPYVRGWKELVARQKELGLNPAKVDEFRWHTEEFRVQLFAQELRTSVPVSAKRLQEMWQGIVKG